jgi:8-oxo-dGTP pyrophosphatase MutT (NUDIX family)
MRNMSDRVRAILITPDRRLVTIKRIKPGRPPYWVLPGGGVEPGDPTLEDALHREIREELGGTADIHALVTVIDHGADRHYFYLGDLRHHDVTRRSGPEFTDPGRGQYILDLIPLTTTGLAGVTLAPPQITQLLTHSIATGTDLRDLPDLRISTRPPTGR